MEFLKKLLNTQDSELSHLFLHYGCRLWISRPQIPRLHEWGSPINTARASKMRFVWTTRFISYNSAAYSSGPWQIEHLKTRAALSPVSRFATQDPAYDGTLPTTLCCPLFSDFH